MAPARSRPRLPPLSKPEYVALGERAVLELLSREHATVWPEVEARVADTTWPGIGRGIDPHHLSTARKRLLARGLILETTTGTRGGRVVMVQHLPPIRGRQKDIELASGRKRLLYARHQGWAQATVRHPQGLIGPAGEAVEAASIRSAALRGRYSFQRPQGGNVSTVFGLPIPGGPIDDYAIHLATESGVPSVLLHLLIEVKNIRPWVYPHSPELHQLLAKASDVQRAHPSDLILPVLVCRRRHITTLNMGQDLGFYAIQTTRQYVMPSADIDPGHFSEVQDGLGYSDLTLSNSADPALVEVFEASLPRDALALARRWQLRFAGITNPSLTARMALHVNGIRRRAVRSLASMRKDSALFPDSLGGW